MTADVSSLSWLILGHRGFIGRSLIQYCRSAEIEWTTLDSRLNLNNADQVIGSKIQENTLALNCIASGVTPESGDLLSDMEINYQLLRILTDSAHRHGAAGFIQFGSNYELTRHILPLSSRSSYVQSKLKGSTYCRDGIKDQRKIQLVYLPTVIGAEQPTGRFFRDFISSALAGKPFQINHPFAEVEIVTIDSMLKQLGVIDHSFKPGVHEIIEDFRGTVWGLATILNEILVDCGVNEVELLTGQSLGDLMIQSTGEEPEVVFREEVKKQILRMIGGNCD